jgi:hypothetical protein
MRSARKTSTRTRSVSRPLVAARSAEREVINGITVTVNGRELAVRVAERIRWHRERGDALITQMKKLTEIERSAAEDLATILGGRYESPRGALERRLREHQDRATFLAFIRDHITPDAVYRLNSSDLKMIDVLPADGC